MSENVRLYGHGHALTSMRVLELGVHDFQANASKSAARGTTKTKDNA